MKNHQFLPQFLQLGTIYCIRLCNECTHNAHNNTNRTEIKVELSDFIVKTKTEIQKPKTEIKQLKKRKKNEFEKQKFENELNKTRINLNQFTDFDIEICLFVC